jgi:hypothetical protein
MPKGVYNRENKEEVITDAEPLMDKGPEPEVDALSAANEKISYLTAEVNRSNRTIERMAKKMGLQVEEESLDDIDEEITVGTSDDGKLILGWEFVEGSRTEIDKATYETIDLQLYDVLLEGGKKERMSYERFRVFITKNRIPALAKGMLFKSQDEYGFYYAKLKDYPYKFSLNGKEPRDVRTYEPKQNDMVVITFVDSEKPVKMERKIWERGKMAKVQVGRLEGTKVIYDGPEMWLHCYTFNPS